MKKLFLTIVFVACFGFPAFGNDGEQEVDFLLFMPDSSNRFVNQDEEMIHLDNIARYLKSRNLRPGQIHVHGYAAAAKNDIDPVDLSLERARFVISELQRRGVPGNLFSEPTAHGDVDLWGGNLDEEDRTPNRRVRIMLDYYLTLAHIADKEETSESKAGFSCCLLFLLLMLLLLLAGLLLYALMNRKKTVTKERLVYLEEEIRHRAYELYLDRHGESEDAKDDWSRAVFEICAKYKDVSYESFMRESTWWAERVVKN